MATLAERNSPSMVLALDKSYHEGCMQRLTMDSTIIDNVGNGVESDSLPRRALGMGGLSSTGDLIALSTSVLVLQREIKLCLRWF